MQWRETGGEQRSGDTRESRELRAGSSLATELSNRFISLTGNASASVWSTYLHTGAHTAPLYLLYVCVKSVSRCVGEEPHYRTIHFIFKLSVSLSLLPASLGPTRREIHPHSPPSNTYHRRPRICSAILQVHLSEFVLFKSPPACFGFHLFTMRGSK